MNYARRGIEESVSGRRFDSARLHHISKKWPVRDRGPAIFDLRDVSEEIHIYIDGRRLCPELSDQVLQVDYGFEEFII